MLEALVEAQQSGEDLVMARAFQERCLSTTNDLLLDLATLKAAGFVDYKRTMPITALTFPVSLTSRGILMAEDASQLESIYPKVIASPPRSEPMVMKGDLRVDNNTVRRGILELLYQAFQQDPYAYVDGSTLTQTLGDVPPNTVTGAIAFMEQEGYVQAERFLGGQFMAKIRSAGIRLLENPSEFNRQFPGVTIINARDIIGSNVASPGSSVVFSNNTFERILDKLIQQGEVPENEATAAKVVVQEMDSVVTDGGTPTSDKVSKLRGLFQQLSKVAVTLSTNPLLLEYFGHLMTQWH